MRMCNTCGQEKEIGLFPQYKGKTGNLLWRWKCKACTTKENVKRIASDPKKREKKKQYDNAWRRANPEKIRQYRKTQKANMKRFTDYQRDNLTERYIRNCLGLKVTDKVPQELIEAKRLQIQIKRLLEEHGHEKHCRLEGRFS